MATQGKYAVVDTTLSITDATVIKELNGRQGDNGRIVYFALKDGRLPHNLDNQDVKLSVKDASGKVKILTGIYDRINVTAGLFSMLIPSEFYQAAGDVEEAYLSVVDNQNTTISSIPITFTVFANGVIISANASKDYIDSIQKILDDFNDRITTTSNNLEIARTAVNSLNDAITNYTNLVNTKAVAVKTSTNEFTENNTFDKDLTVKGAIHGNADTATKLANDSTLVHKSGNESIAGNKTFTDTVTAGGTKITDSGWKNLSSLSSSVKYRILNGVVYLSVISTREESGSEIATLPVGARPGQDIWIPYHSGGIYGNYKVQPDGRIKRSSESSSLNDYEPTMFISFPADN